ncbi:MAG: hypothetical protein KDI36_12420, partial [Pseudomonadales bacterium]|nr:hypothetical protein [Pseudomonadales bacterium]
MKRFSVLFFLMTGAVAVTAEDNTPATAVSVAAEIPFTEAVAERYPETAAAGSASAVRHYSTMNTSYDHCHYSEEHQHDHCYEAGEPHACPSQTTTRTVYRDRRVIIDDSPADD